MEENYKNYEVYGDSRKNEVIVENIHQKLGYNGKNSSIEDESTVIMENNPQKEQLPNLQWEEYMHPDFQWQKRNLWINNPKAVNYWLKSKGGTVKELVKIRNDEENTKTY
mgnify:FL=1